MKKKTMIRFVGWGASFIGTLCLTLFAGTAPVFAQVAPPPPPPPLPEFPAPVLTLSVAPTSIHTGESAVISWTSSDTASCTASGDWSGSKALTGSQNVSPSATATYTLSCTGSFLGTVERSVTLTVVSDNPDTTSPTKPTGLVGSVVSRSQINLSWTASTDPIVVGSATSGVSGYRIERCQGSSCSNFSQIGTATETTYSDTELSSYTYYRYRIRAVDGAGNVSSYSSVIRKRTWN